MSTTIKKLVAVSAKRSQRWHKGSSWSMLEWAGAMCGEAGECANAAKKLKRLSEQMKSLTQRQVDTKARVTKKVIQEAADTILYAVIILHKTTGSAERAEQALRDVFNKKSEQYEFPERI